MTKLPHHIAHIIAALVLLLAVQTPARAGDTEDCVNAEALLKTEPARAVAACRKLAEQGDAEAQVGLGFMYDHGLGVPQDYTEAMKWYHKAAEQSDGMAQFNLGQMYRSGQGVPPDYAEAAKWYRLAAEQGVAEAKNNLGTMYINGLGVPQDYAEAVRWFQKAAEQSVAMAQYSLGFIYAHGQGVPQDYVQAHMWFNLAAAQGNEGAAKQRDIAASLMTPADISKAQHLAREWLEWHQQ